MDKRILIVDDEPNVRMSYRAALESESGYLIEEANSAFTALEKLVAGRFDLAILTFQPTTTNMLKTNTRPFNQSRDLDMFTLGIDFLLTF